MPQSSPSSPAKVSMPRCAALVGPYLSGKTTLLESLLFSCGATSRKGSTRDGNTVGDASVEARARKMSVEMNLATADYLGERWSFLDCPGSVELAAETRNALMVADLAVVVVEPVPERALTVAPLFKYLDDNNIPHVLFINKVDTLSQADTRIRDVLEAYQGISSRKLVLREVPLRDGDAVTGFVDLVSERAWHFNPHAASDLVPVPDTARETESSARQEMLEALSDFDDTLLEQLLEDVAPEKEEIYRQLTKDFAADLIVPVLLGSAENDNGVRRLLKLLRHEGPDPTATALRLGHELEGTGPLAQVFKTYLAPHVGRLRFVRVWQGGLSDGMGLGGERVSGLFRVTGSETQKISEAQAGDVVALGRMEKPVTGDLLTDKGLPQRPLFWPELPQAVFAMAVMAENRNDEVKLSGALHRLCEEDVALRFEHDPHTAELVLWGQGDIHLQIAADRLRNRYNVPVSTRIPQIPYKETIRRPLNGHHARFKRQSGGHGQFADIVIDIKPLPRGEGFTFTDSVVGGSVPRQYIPAVENGVREYFGRGPLGFPVEDFSVNLCSGQFHAVDSSEMAFKTAARQAMVEAMPKCEPVLLEPILAVTITGPAEFTSKINTVISSRRGQILGFDGKPGWNGWDEVRCTMPQAEMHDLIVELRSLTMGVGFYSCRFERLSELTGRLADKVVEQRKARLAEAG